MELGENKNPDNFMPGFECKKNLIVLADVFDNVN